MSPKNLIVPLCLSFLFFVSNCHPPQPSAPVWEQKKYYYPGGELESIYWLKDGKQDSIMVTYDRQGNKTGVLRFRNDKQEGKSEYFYPSGKLKETHFYVDGKKEGAVTTWYESGNKQVEANYLNDKKHGIFRQWKEDGTLLFETNFLADTIVVNSQE